MLETVKPSSAKSMGMFARIIVGVIFAIATYGLEEVIDRLFMKSGLLPYLARQPAGWFGASVAALIIGSFLYLLKLRILLLYAWLELAVAAATASSAIAQLAHSKDGWTFVLAFLGSVYISVRGFTNLTEASPELLRRLKGKGAH